MKPILSILIPTKNRYDYLIGSIESIINTLSGDFEIVVQDNSDDNTYMKEYLKKNPINNLKYFHISKKISMSDNVDKAIKNSVGKFVCFIGDDDSVSNKILEVVKYMELNQVDACTVNMSKYYWPDVVFAKKSQPNVSFDDNSLKIKKINSTKMLKKYRKGGFLDLSYLPRIYHGIVSRKCLDEVFEITNSYNPGPSPDMANAVALSLVVKNHIYINKPIIVSGTSYNSGAGLGVRGKHKANLKDVEFLPKNIEAEWNSNLPKIWLASTIWPQSAFEALNKMGRNDLSEEINYYPIYSDIYLRHNEYYSLVKKIKKNSILFFYNIIVTILKYLIVIKLFGKFKKRRRYNKKNMSILEACKITNDYLSDLEIIK